MNKAYVVLIFAFFFSFSAYAQETEEKTEKKEESPWSLILSGISHHYSNSDNRKCHYEERNEGIGLKYDKKTSFWGENHSVYAVTYQNSFCGVAALVGYGLSKEVLRLGNFGFTVGALALAGVYEYPEEKKWGPKGGIAPTLSADYKKIAFNLMVVPSSNIEKINVTILFVSIPFDTIRKLGI